MKLWRPNKAQWVVIWVVYALALCVSVDWMKNKVAENTTAEYRSPYSDGYYVEVFSPSLLVGQGLAFLVTGGLLAVWTLQRPSN